MNMEINAEAGQQALTCQMHYFQEVKEGQGLLKKTMIWYDTKIDAPGKEKTVIDEYGKKIEVPNALIIPLAKEAKVKKGDRVRCIDLDRYKDGYTVQVDMEHGHIWTQADGSKYTHCFGLADVTKVLDK